MCSVSIVFVATSKWGKPQTCIDIRETSDVNDEEDGDLDGGDTKMDKQKCVCLSVCVSVIVDTNNGTRTGK